MTTAIAAITQPDRFWYEARRYCEEHDDRNRDSVNRVVHALRFQAYQEAIQPFQQILMGLYAYKLPKHIRHADGSLESVYEWNEDEQKTLAQVKELVADTARRFGLAPNTSSG